MKQTMILLVVLLASCSGGDDAAPADTQNTQPPIQSNNTLDWDNSNWNDSNWK